jgi:carbon starvation protein
VQELAGTLRIKPLTNKYAATLLAVVLAGWVAMLPADATQPADHPLGSAGTGGLILWPLFGATNQLLAGLAFMVTMFYLWRRGRPVWFIAIPMTMMLIMPAWAMLWQMFNSESGWYHKDQTHLLWMGVAILGIQVWMIVEALLLLPRVKGVLEDALPPLVKPALAGTDGSSSPAC